ncbi:MAG TPA: tyrosine-type recombinase/integrase [Bryobacteraceae bacterium]
MKKQKGKWVGMFYDSTGSHRSRVLGPVKSMTKTQARAAVNKFADEANAKVDENRVWTFGEFVSGPYYEFYGRKWKRSTRENNVYRVNTHLVSAFGDRALSSLKRDELQDLLDAKANAGLSYSTVDHLRWDAKQIFDMAVAEGRVQRNPAMLLFTPREAAKPVRRVMTLKEVQTCFEVLDGRERLICKLGVVAGMRPGEIFALTWGRMTAAYADIRQRTYRNVIDTPKTNQSVRQAALPEGLLREIEAWRAIAVDTCPEAWVFPSERMTPLSKDNCFRRSIHPKLSKVGLGWVNFLVLRRTHSSLMKALGVDGKLVADQLGHSLDVNQNVYTSTAVELRQVALNQLEQSLSVN